MTKYVEVKTRSLTGKALDWAVATALNGKKIFLTVFGSNTLGFDISNLVIHGNIKPTTDWGQCGLLIDEYNIEFKWVTDMSIEAHSHCMSEKEARGLDHRTAACRLIALELGETVMVPAELVLQSSR